LLLKDASAGASIDSGGSGWINRQCVDSVGGREANTIIGNREARVYGTPPRSAIGALECSNVSSRFNPVVDYGSRSVVMTPAKIDKAKAVAGFFAE
jgi:hypothetical protein